MISVEWDQLFQFLGQLLCVLLCIVLPIVLVASIVGFTKAVSDEWPWQTVWREWRDSRRSKK